MNLFNLSLPIVVTLLAASFSYAAEQPKVTTPETPTEKGKSYSEAAVSCSEAADKAENEDKWDEAFQACMKTKGFNNSPTNIPAIPDSESDAQEDM